MENEIKFKEKEANKQTKKGKEGHHFKNEKTSLGSLN